MYCIEEVTEIAETIINQIGHPCLLMIGARKVVFGSLPEDSNEKGVFVSFAIGNNPKGINRIRIIYQAGPDTYSIEFYRIRGVKSQIISMENDIYCEDLARIIGEVTGLEIALPRFASGRPD